MSDTQQRPAQHVTRAINSAPDASSRPLADAEPVTRVAPASAADFQRDLSRYWRYVRGRGEIGLTARGWIYKTAFKPLLAALNEPAGGPESEAEHPRLFFMRQLLTALRELAVGPGALTTRPDGQFFHLPLPARIRQSFETWRDMVEDGETSAAGAPPDRAPLPPRHTGPAAALPHDLPPWIIRARAALLRALTRAGKTLALEQSLRTNHAQAGRAPQARWISVAALLDMAAGPDSADQRHAPAQAAARRPDRVSMVSMLAGPLHWLGLIDLGYADVVGEADAPAPAGLLPTACRLTDTGLWLLDLADQPAYVESGGRVLAQPNFTILAMEPISDQVLMALDQFADLQGGDRATSYQLTRQSVYRGQRAGWDVERIVSFLEAHQGAPLPPNIRRTLDEWQAQHRRIVFHREARVAQFADEAAQQAVTDALAQAGIETVALGPGWALAPAGAPAAALIAALRDAGWSPQISPANGAGPDDTEGCLRLVPSPASPAESSESFNVVFKHPTPSLFALGQLTPLTGPAEPGRALQITAAGVRGALAAGMTLDEILATLAHLHDGPLPLPVEQRIRDWARFFGRASARTVCLFEFSSAEVLHNLLDDETTGRYLKLIEGSAQPVAVVDVAHAGMVRELLTERGIEITE